MTKRKYTKRRRAEQEAETRRRIVEAAVELHGSLGPRDTSISAVAERAGVQRLTVYRHFPDDHALFQACTTHWLAANPPPDPEGWSTIADPEDRSRAALSALYAYYRRTSYMWRLAYRDLDDLPALQGPMRDFDRYLDAVRDGLLEAWSPSASTIGGLRAVTGHVLGYSTWASLAGEELGDREIAGLATAWLGRLAAGGPGDR